MRAPLKTALASWAPSINIIIIIILLLLLNYTSYQAKAALNFFLPNVTLILKDGT